MKKLFYISALSIICFAAACTSNETENSTYKDLRAGFATPPDSIQTSVYWYWISDHISEQGVIKDLNAMKQAGINRAFIGNIGLEDRELQGGKVKFGTEEWWRILHTALKTATELNIEIGIFNSPGWSQSGGPWVKPNQAMRYLASTSHRISGGRKIDTVLTKPDADFEDVKLIAYPAVNTGTQTLSLKNAAIRSNNPVQNLNLLLDGNKNSGTALGKNIILDFTSHEPFTLRSVKIYAGNYRVNAPAKIQAEEDGTYATLAEFIIDRYNTALNVGFDPYAPVVISVPATTVSNFRLIIDDAAGLNEIEFSSVPFIERYPEKTLAKMFQSPLPYWNEYQWRDQPAVNDHSLTVNPADVTDLSQYFDNGRLVWEAPQGEWIVMRTGMLPTGVTNAPASREATGLEIDKMSKKHTEAHFNAFMGEVLRRIPAADRKSWKVIVQDSYETGGQNFTDGLLNEFEQRYGYSALPFLPVFEGIVVQSEEISDRFLWDLRRMVADKVAYDYVGGLRETGHKHGLTTWLENYGHWGFPGEFLQYGGQSDEIGGEFWGEGDLGNIENRAASSCGHIYGKNKISAESFTTAHQAYKRYPAMIKQRGDRFFSEGINNTLLHVYIHQPYEDERPGINTWFGTEFNRFNTWFPQLDLFTGYLKRVNFMLQQGINVADVAYFIGEDAPKMTGIADPALPKGYQFDYINAEVIEKYLYVENGLLTLPHGTQYKILVLPKLETMRPELLQKINRLISDGATVMGPAPKRSPSYRNYPQADKEVGELASSMWGKIDQNTRYAQIGKGKLINGMDMQQALNLINCVPDCKTPDDAPILYGHRTLSDGEIYFVTNQSNETVNITPEFRVKNKQPELWEPTTGRTRALPAYTGTETGTTVALTLEANESAFVVFIRPAGKQAGKAATNFPAPQAIATINGPWEVSFSNQLNGAVAPATFETLSDLSENENFDIKHYAGTIVYKSRFTLGEIPEGNLVINLNNVYIMAKVKINNQYAGGVWTPPYRVDITDYVKQGENEVEIEVVNTWVNRLIGDAQLPEKDRTTRIRLNPWKAGSPLEKSGLVGPVSIENILY